MAERNLDRLLRQIRKTAGDCGGVSDAALLERFTSIGDEAAFELLLWRHQKLVFSVCRRVLNNYHEAEDAFQATFLILARKGASIAKREALAGWLYRVAYRTALTARADRGKRRSREQSLEAAGEPPASPDPAPSPERKELWAAVTEEVGRLPARYQGAAVLCYLEGKTVDQAARQLGCPRGTVASRLARARERLRVRLARRGLAFSAGALAAALPPAELEAAAPEHLIRPVVRAAGQLFTGKTVAASGIAPRAAALTKEVLRAMFLKKIASGVVALAALVCVLILGGGLLGGGSPAASGNSPEAPRAEKDKAPPKKPASPAPRVLVIRPVRKVVTPYQDFPGRLVALKTVQIRSRVSGYLVKVAVKAGADVKKGDLLFEIDPRPYQAALDQAKANLTLANAQVKQAEAELTGIQIQKDNKKLKELNQAAAKREAALANRDVAKAAVQVALLNLDFTKIRAPMVGRVGRLTVATGDLVTGGGNNPTLLTTLFSVDPLGVTFDMDERSFLVYQRLVRQGRLKAPPSPLRIALGDDKGFSRAGTLDSFERQANPKYGTIGVRGTVPNPRGELLPGMFVRIRVPFGRPHKALLVPEAAILSDQGSKYVLVVNNQHVVERRAVKLGPQEGDLRAIEDGLKPDEWVVPRGPNRLRPGDKVTPHPVK